MNQRLPNKKSFRSLLAQVAPMNAQSIMRRARLANSLAKTTNGRARRAAYNVKTDALVALTKGFPNRVSLQYDLRLPQMIVVRDAADGFALHAPAHRFTSQEAKR
ncbi:MAG: hypothetical protein ACRD68_08165 [Pyrinomonadaceae bacterium]